MPTLSICSSKWRLLRQLFFLFGYCTSCIVMVQLMNDCNSLSVNRQWRCESCLAINARSLTGGGGHCDAAVGLTHEEWVTADWQLQLQKWNVLLQADNVNGQCENYSTNYDSWMEFGIENYKIRITGMGQECFFPNFWMDIFVPAIEDKSWCDASIVNRDKYLESSLSWDTPHPRFDIHVPGKKGWQCRHSSYLVTVLFQEPTNDAGLCIKLKRDLCGTWHHSRLPSLISHCSPEAKETLQHRHQLCFVVVVSELLNSRKTN